MQGKTLLDAYEEIVGKEVIAQLRQLAEPLMGAKIVHINSTKDGGGVAEILANLIPLKQALGLDATWEIIDGNATFFECTKGFHNALQGIKTPIPSEQFRAYEEVNRQNSQRLEQLLSEADFVFIHDPQPAMLINHIPHRKGKWIWRCHIDASHPYRFVWNYLKNIVSKYDASIFSMPSFAQPLPHPQYLIAPSIDPLGDKNKMLEQKTVQTECIKLDIDPSSNFILQISRFDRFKDPVGVIEAYRLAKRYIPDLSLVLAGGTASDDPEGEAVLKDVMSAAGNDEDIHILLLPPRADIAVNALQRASSIVLQKSLKEGFGLTVSEALWKNKPVIGGRTGGITLQVIDHHTGFLVDTPEGAAMKIRYLLTNPEKIQKMGEKGANLVKENFLLTRQLREYLTLLLSLSKIDSERIELD